MTQTSGPARFIDPRGQRFGAGASAVTLAIAVLLGLPTLVLVVAVALGVSSALGTRWFLFGRPWPLIRATLGLGKTEPEHEIPPRFAQALGATCLTVALLLFLVGSALGWALVIAVISLQTLLAATGYCLGCRLYGLKWYVPHLFDRLIGVDRLGPGLPRRTIERVG